MKKTDQLRGLNARHVKWTAEMDQFLRLSVSRGYCNVYIAHAMGLGRCSVRKRRKKVGLPPGQGPKTCEHCRDTVRATVRKICSENGVGSLGELKQVRVQQAVRRSGWPEGLSLGEVKILDLLNEYGPMTLREINGRLGRTQAMAQVRKGPTRKRVFTSLCNRGLVVRVGGQSLVHNHWGNEPLTYSLAFDVTREVDNETADDGPLPAPGPGA